MPRHGVMSSLSSGLLLAAAAAADFHDAMVEVAVRAAELQAALQTMPVPRGGPGPIPSFTADLHVTFPMPEPPSTSPIGRMFYEPSKQRWRQQMEIPNDLFKSGETMRMDAVIMNRTGLNYNNTVGFGEDAVCKPMPASYYDLFGVLAQAQPAGSSSVDNVPCTRWVANVSLPNGQNMEATACIAADGVPRLFNSTIWIFPWPNVMRFTNVQVGSVADAEFETSKACASNYPTAPCDVTKDKEVQTIRVYRFHGKTEPMTLAERNAGDALGDMAFVCLAKNMQAFASQYVSLWELPVNASFGQYGYCLFRDGKNVCVGGSDRLVGRESPMGLGVGKLQGQCSVNDDVGIWYSFPAKGECGPGEPIGTNGCTWGPAVRLRTVEASCMEERGLENACHEEVGHAPFTRAARIFATAVRTDDVSQGGCPDADVGQEEVIV